MKTSADIPTTAVAVLPPEYSGLKRPKTSLSMEYITPIVLFVIGFGLLYFLISLIIADNLLVRVYDYLRLLRDGEATQATIPWDEVIILMITFICTLLSFYMGLTYLHRLRLLALEGQQTQAIVFDRWLEKGDESVSYNVAYAYKIPTPQGQQIITRSEYSKTL